MKKLDATLLKKMFLAGAKNLEAKKEWINELNVFPVPDGDTGTNMTMTIMSAADEVAALNDPDFATLGKAISTGSLRGARGNSGVILSQLLRGFTKEVKKVSEIDSAILAGAVERAVETAYKAVMKPKEGTILTVARGVAEKTIEMAKQTDDLETIMREAIAYGDEVLSQTPDMLPVLKQAGVVDSGGQGLMQVLKGAFDAFLGKEIDYESDAGEDTIPSGYNMEYTIVLEKEPYSFAEKELRSYLSTIGENVSVTLKENKARICLCTEDPGLALQKGLSYGILLGIRIENIKEEQNADKKLVTEEEKPEDEIPEQPEKEVGFVAIAAGSGMADVFRELGVDVVIEGGQTMNPSTDDILKAIDKINAKHIFVFPNNKNIILAANQAASMTKNKEIIVIPSKTIPQGITAMINYMEGASVKENQASMEEQMNLVKTGEITYAVRDTQIDDKIIKENDIMGIGDEGILCVGTDVEQTTVDMISMMIGDDSEIVTIYYGAERTEEDAQTVAEQVSEQYPGIECEITSGGQAVYYYIVSVE